MELFYSQEESFHHGEVRVSCGLMMLWMQISFCVKLMLRPFSAVTVWHQPLICLPFYWAPFCCWGAKLLIPCAYFTGKIPSEVKPTSSFLGLAFRKGSKPGNLGWIPRMDFAYKILASCYLILLLPNWGY